MRVPFVPEKPPVIAYVMMSILIVFIILSGLFYRMPDSGAFYGFNLPDNTSATKGLTNLDKRR